MPCPYEGQRLAAVQLVAARVGQVQPCQPVEERLLITPPLTSVFANYDLSYTHSAARGIASSNDLGALTEVGVSGALGVFTLVYSTSMVLRSPEVDSPLPGALMLFAGVFNIFVATLNILLRLLGGGRRD